MLKLLVLLMIHDYIQIYLMFNVEDLDCDSLQSDLNCVYDWAKTNNMVVNSQKFKYLYYIDT